VRIWCRGVRSRGAGISAQERGRRYPGRRVHAELDGFELAAMIAEHPRFQKTAMIFISAIQVSDSTGCAAMRWAPSTTYRCRWCRKCCAQDQGVRRNSIARRGTGAA